MSVGDTDSSPPATAVKTRNEQFISLPIEVGESLQAFVERQQRRYAASFRDHIGAEKQRKEISKKSYIFHQYDSYEISYSVLIMHHIAQKIKSFRLFNQKLRPYLTKGKIRPASVFEHIY